MGVEIAAMVSSYKSQPPVKQLYATAVIRPIPFSVGYTDPNLMSSSSQRLILFDVDQTLLSTRGGDRKALNTAFSELYEIEDAFEGVGFGGRMDLSIMAEVYRINEVAEGHRRLDDFKAIYFGHLARILPEWDNGIVYPGVRELLRALESEGGVQLGLATGNFREAAFIKLRRYGLDGYFVEGGFGGDHPERPEVVADAISKCQEIVGKVYERIRNLRHRGLDIRCEGRPGQRHKFRSRGHGPLRYSKAGLPAPDPCLPGPV